MRGPPALRGDHVQTPRRPRQRPEAYTLPLAAPDVTALLAELIHRGLFDAELAIQAASAEGLFCWETPTG